MTLAQRILHRGITEVLHFTTNRGVVGTLACQALLSRRKLPENSYLEHVLHPNAKSRPETSTYFDKSADWLDYVNLSISELNRRFFLVSERWHADQDVWWAILSFDANIITHEGVYLATTNNGYDLCRRQKGVDGFEALFAPRIGRKSPTWSVSRGDRPDFLPTCEQAEVLYPEHVSTEHLRRIYVKTGEHGDCVRGWLRELGPQGVDVVVNTQKFIGRYN